MQTVKKTSFLILLSLFFSTLAMAQKPVSAFDDPTISLMFIVVCTLALIVGLMGYVLLSTASFKLKKDNENSAHGGSSLMIALVMACSLLSMPVMAQDSSSPLAQQSSSIHNPEAYYMLVGVIFLELTIIIMMLIMMKYLLRVEKVAKPVTEEEKVANPHLTLNWWDKFNSFKPLTQEADIDMGHDYDGIRELDNRLPPWWLYGFYLCILFAVVYLWRYHVDGSAPLSKEEFEISMAEGEAAKAAYLAKAASNVDENTVKFIENKDELAGAKKIFETTCSACHGKEGQGGVGPNLTDDYWLHGGSIKDIFKTIKYGWPDKGMRSWKDDYSPIQIAQISSYVKLLKGTNPPNPKGPQGDFFNEGKTSAPANTNPPDSTKKDSLSKSTVFVK